MKKILFFFLFSLPIYAQELDSLLVVNDSIVRLTPVWVFGQERKFTSEDAKNRYKLLKYRVKKVYPYAKLAAEELKKIEKVLDTLPNNRKKKQYTKKIQEETEQKFTDELKKLSRSQGRILIKLIYRQTGESAFDLVKNLRSGWRAFWYNNTAWLYDLSLKSVYDPMNVYEDFWIEEILLRCFSMGELEAQNPAIPIDYQEIENKWKDKK